MEKISISHYSFIARLRGAPCNSPLCSQITWPDKTHICRAVHHLGALLASESTAICHNSFRDFQVETLLIILIQIHKNKNLNVFMEFPLAVTLVFLIVCVKGAVSDTVSHQTALVGTRDPTRQMEKKTTLHWCC